MTDPVVVGPSFVESLLGSETQAVEPSTPSADGSSLTHCGGPTRAGSDQAVVPSVASNGRTPKAKDVTAVSSNQTSVAADGSRAWPDDRQRNTEFANWLRDVTTPRVTCPRTEVQVTPQGVVVAHCPKQMSHYGKCKFTVSEGRSS